MSTVESRIPNAATPTAPLNPGTEGTGGFRRTVVERETADNRLLNRVSALRDRTTDLDDDVRALHHQVRDFALDERTTAAALRDPRDLLKALSHEYGLSWSAIARLTGVSPTAVRKWRRGETIAPDNRRALARSVTFLEIIGENAAPIVDIGSWLEMPLSDRATLTPLDLYAMGKMPLLIDHVAERLPAHAMLDEADPDWREHYASDGAFTVVDGGDGHLTIIEKPE